MATDRPGIHKGPFFVEQHDFSLAGLRKGCLTPLTLNMIAASQDRLDYFPAGRAEKASAEVRVDVICSVVGDGGILLPQRSSATDAIIVGIGMETLVYHQYPSFEGASNACSEEVGPKSSGNNWSPMFVDSTVVFIFIFG